MLVSETKKESVLNAAVSIDVGLISAYDAVRWGLKPCEVPVLEMFKQYSGRFNQFRSVFKPVSEGVYIGVVGDRFVDLKLGLNLEKSLKTSVSGSKVRVANILMNRYGKSSDLADYSVNSLSSLACLIKSECFDIVVCDVDNTLFRSFVPKESGEVRSESKFDRFGRMLPVRGGYLLFTLSDTFLSFLGVHNREAYSKSEGCLDDVFRSVESVGGVLVLDTSTNPLTVKSAVCRNSEFNVNFFYNRFF